MTLFQALIIGLLGWMSSIYSPVLVGGLGGWYTLGRPLVSGMVIGLILGDVKTGIILGAAIQSLYIGLVTPGGSMPSDVNFAAWIGIPLALVAGAGTEYALAISVPLSVLGVAAAYATVSVNLYFVHKQDALIEAGELEKAINIPIIGQITNFVARFSLIFLINYFGADFATNIINVMPEWLSTILQMFAPMLPLIGFTLLLKMIVKKKLDLIFFVFGFFLVAVMKLDMISIVILGALLAYVLYKSNNKEVSL
ncbi:PTS sugar transporter subunit IIC [Clostridium sp.]|uniref:PTS mannose/fructose/sorbose/N-acetylgalactosamine transporter subunit IIC n=1 Tax=Clostridium sp. TaxID=1506 RepID=UPI002910D12E|nr:PTS sugar transporter subunit IIC [Clostridium sp.]MDU5107848.1 PTS sugar transporter subunit IIC [Clostridium sp.]